MTAIRVNAINFARAESNLMFSRLLADTGGLGVWHHYREPAPLDHQPIVRQNRDTLYSAAIVDVTRSATLTLPDPGARYLSVMVVNQDHYLPKIFHEPGVYELKREELGTDYVLLAARILVDPGDAADVAEVNRLQDALGLSSAQATPFELPAYDEDSMTRTRQALLQLSEGLPDFRSAFGRSDEVDPVRHLIASASGWGGLPETEAHYVNVNPGLPVGEYSLRMVDPPVDGFWSISLYNAEGYFVPNELGVNNVNSVTAAPDPDGAVTVHFGVDPADKANFLPVMEGWNFLIRLYRPRPEVLDGTWQVPPVVPAR
ncbi:DUF1214 domain-containing protein [Nocardioides sp. CCNWLW239]|uniref:DUF1214 domain-containing protein n=1 Tax=Nocardioides sp. CCNWLW239 TaxID=3128902 RepID=UPI00301916D1